MPYVRICVPRYVCVKVCSAVYGSRDAVRCGVHFVVPRNARTLFALTFDARETLRRGGWVGGWVRSTAAAKPKNAHGGRLGRVAVCRSSDARKVNIYGPPLHAASATATHTPRAPRTLTATRKLAMAKGRSGRRSLYAPRNTYVPLGTPHHRLGIVNPLQLRTSKPSTPCCRNMELTSPSQQQQTCICTLQPYPSLKLQA